MPVPSTMIIIESGFVFPAALLGSAKELELNEILFVYKVKIAKK